MVRIQEGDPVDYETLMSRMRDVDIILWTRTGDLAAKWGHKKQLDMLRQAERLDIPTIGFHLDRWWGLDREHLVSEEPFFQCSVVFTADGGHQDEFKAAGVNHIWLPPAVSLAETVPGECDKRFDSDIAFVGSWQPGYHKEWKHRPQLIDWLSKTYPHQVKFWPRPNEHAVRGTDLRNLYATARVIVGDSCLVGGVKNYWSDRIPETLGRGGYLIHPYVEGIREHFTPGEHLVTWPLYDWKELKRLIDLSLALAPTERREIAEDGRAHVITYHSYDVRVNQILKVIGK